MAEVQCMYCGKAIPEDVDTCPHCAAPSHFQKRGVRLTAQRRFLIFFVLFTVFCFIMFFWLPRNIAG